MGKTAQASSFFDFSCFIDFLKVFVLICPGEKSTNIPWIAIPFTCVSWTELFSKEDLCHLSCFKLL